MVSTKLWPNSPNSNSCSWVTIDRPGMSFLQSVFHMSLSRSNVLLKISAESTPQKIPIQTNQSNIQPCNFFFGEFFYTLKNTTTTKKSSPNPFPFPSPRKPASCNNSSVVVSTSHSRQLISSTASPPKGTRKSLKGKEVTFTRCLVFVASKTRELTCKLV